MAKKKAFIPLLYLTSIVFLPWWISFSFKKNMESWVTNWSNTRQSEILLNDIQEKSILKKFIELEELLLLDEMIKEYPETRLQNLRIGIYKETIQLIKTHNEDLMNTILHFSTNIICFVILSGYSILGNQELIILSSWVQEFLYNLSDTIKAFSFLLLTDLCIGFHSTHGWELMIGSVYKDFGFAHNDQILSGLVSTFPVILDTILKYWIFRYLNRLCPLLVYWFLFSSICFLKQNSFPLLATLAANLSNKYIACLTERNRYNALHANCSLVGLGSWCRRTSIKCS